MMKKLLLALVFALPAQPGRADLIAGAPSPGERILIIYTNTTGYGIQIRDGFVAALSAIVPAPTINQVVISAGDGTGPGFYDELQAQTGQTNLNQWCQVYDLRFRDDRNNLGFTGQNQEDVVTYLGANNDTLLFTNYLNSGGSLFLQGEHHDYYIRNTNLINFVNSVANAPITQATGYPDVYTGSVTVGGFPAAPENFNTDFNNISAGTVNTNFPGGINTAARGSGRPIGANIAGAYGGAANTALGYLPGDLRTAGRLVVSFETNAFTEPALRNATSDGWVQNVYDLLSGCYRYTITKAFNPTQLCVGSPGQFTLCYTNTSAIPLSNITIWDTIPTCLSFGSAVPPPTSNTGNLYRWVFPTIGVGASACITVNFTATTFPPCP